MTPAFVAALRARWSRRRHAGDDVDRRRPDMTEDQIRVARHLLDTSPLTRDAVADAFWVTRETLDECLRGDERPDAASHAS